MKQEVGYIVEKDSHSKILQNAITKERLQNSNKNLGRRGLVFA